jgi:PhnB protein
LRELPGPDFKARLRADLERNISMSTKMKEVVFRPGFRTVTPYLLPPNPEYVDFLKGVFGAEETQRKAISPTSFHSEVKIGDSMLMLGVGSGRSMPVSLLVYVENSDETYRRALAAGAKAVTPMIENYGDRFGCVQDPGGNSWCIAKYIGPQSIGQEHVNTVTLCFSLKGSVRFIDFLKQAFNATEIVRYDAEGEVKHAKMRIGDSAVAVGEAHDDWPPLPAMMRLYVPNVDAVYEQALRAGATSIRPPADQPYGDREGGVTDEWGNQWYMATPL